MKRFILLFSLLITGLLSSSQESETRWLNEYFHQVPKAKAAYKQEFTVQDSVLTMKITGLKTRREIIEHYRKDRPVGKWQEKYNGRVKVERDFDSIDYTPYKHVESGLMLADSTIEELPSFPGGDKKRIEFLVKKTKYPRIARELGIRGTTIINFILTPEGTIESVAVAESSHPYLDYEAVRVVKAMPAWSPGRQNGKAVTVQFDMPIRFSLTN